MAEFSYVHALLALAIGGAAWAFYREVRLKRPANPPMPPEGELYGVRGWLLWMVSAFIFIGPALSLGRTAQELSATVSLYPSLESLPVWHAYTLATWMMVAVTCLLSMTAGVGLEKQRDRRVVRQAMAVLWVNGPVAYIVHGVLIPLALLGKSGAGALYAVGFSIAVFGAGAWTAYLLLSRRVRNTYGLAPVQAEAVAPDAQASEELP